MFESSANVLIMLHTFTSKLLMHITNLKSPSTNPCGIEFVTDLLSETKPSGSYTKSILDPICQPALDPMDSNLLDQITTWNFVKCLTKSPCR